MLKDEEFTLLFEVAMEFGGRQRGCRQWPATIGTSQVPDGPKDLAVRHAPVEELVHHHRLGDVLEAVDAWGFSRPRRAYVAATRPLSNTIPGDTRKPPYFA